MALNNYIELTATLFKDYLKSVSSAVQSSEEKSKPKQLQWSVEVSGGTILVININQLFEPDQLQINVIYNKSDNKIENLLVNWKVLPSVKFPLDKIAPSVSEAFIKMIASQIDEKSLKTYIQDAANDSKHVVSAPDKEQTVNSDFKASFDPPTGFTPLQSDTTLSRSRPADMPGFEDELEILRPLNPPPQTRDFPTIGDSDLNPPGLPRNPELKPFIDPLSNPNNDGGMYPGPNHPLFGSGRPGASSRLGVPPGARYDDPLSEDNLDALGSGLPGNLRLFGGNQFGNQFGNQYGGNRNQFGGGGPFGF